MEIVLERDPARDGRPVYRQIAESHPAGDRGRPPRRRRATAPDSRSRARARGQPRHRGPRLRGARRGRASSNRRSGAGPSSAPRPSRGSRRRALPARVLAAHREAPRLRTGAPALRHRDGRGAHALPGSRPLALPGGRLPEGAEPRVAAGRGGAAALRRSPGPPAPARGAGRAAPRAPPSTSTPTASCSATAPARGSISPPASSPRRATRWRWKSRPTTTCWR